MCLGASVIVSLGTISTRNLARSKGMHIFLESKTKQNKQTEYIKK